MIFFFGASATSPGAVTYTGRDLVEQACYEINVIAAGDTLDGTNAVFGLSKLARLLDNWNTDDKALFAESFLTYVLTPALNPHTIGASGATWTVTTRPQKIDGATLVTGSGTTAARYPLTMRDVEWWESLPIQGTAGQPTDLYYDPSYPRGSVYLWPVPSAADSIELLVKTPISGLALTDTVSFPPGYVDAVILTLAESLATPFEKQVSPQLALSARQARARIFDANDRRPTGSTTDLGLGAGGADGTYLTGWWSRR
jgi:hypothetical protein